MNWCRAKSLLRSARLRTDDAPQEGHFQRWVPAVFRPFFTSFTLHNRHRVELVVFVTTNRCGH